MKGFEKIEGNRRPTQVISIGLGGRLRGLRPSLSATMLPDQHPMCTDMH